VLKAMKPIRILKEKFGSMNFAADMDNQGGIYCVDSNLADFATISARKEKYYWFRCLGTGTKPKKP
jgi:hypothetical protein